jgi:hypothetical protein
MVVLGPFLYNVYSADIPTHPNALLATFADDTYVLAGDSDPNTTSQSSPIHLQDHLSSIQRKS